MGQGAQWAPWVRGTRAPDGVAVTRRRRRRRSTLRGRSHFGASSAGRPVAMAHGGGHAVLVSGLPGGAATEDLLSALNAAGHRPLAVGVPAAAAEQGRCYVTFHEAAEADDWPVLWGSRRSRKAGKSQRKGLLQAAGHMNRGLGHFEPRLCFSHCALSVLIDFNCFLQHLSSLTRGQIWPEPRMKLQQIIFEF